MKKQSRRQKLTVNPGQGAVFSFKVPSRVKIELVEPEDRPKTADYVRKASKTSKNTN
jgi:hypothetical protein